MRVAYRAAPGVGLALMALVSLAPFLWSVLTSLRPPSELLATPALLPGGLSLESYADVFAQRPFGRYLWNSLLVGLASTTIALAVGSLAAATLSHLERRLAMAIELVLLFFALWPPAVLLVPLFTVGRLLGLVNSLMGLALVHAALNTPFAAWMLTTFFRQIPRELEDAARVDGFSRLQYLTRVALPLAAPALAATAILVFIFSWNEFVVALAFLSRDELRTVPVGVAMLTGVTMYEIPWGQISAAVVMTTAPVVATVLVFQRWIVAGLTAGAVKG